MFYGIPPGRELDFQRALETLAGIYPNSLHAQDMLIAIGRSLSFRQDRRFAACFAKVAENDQERSLLWRVHVLCWAGRQALLREGDFVECGVLHGFSSAVVCRFLDFARLRREFFLYDTFAGLPPETSTAQERQLWNVPYRGRAPGEVIARVRERFASFPNVRVVEGVIPDSFAVACPERIAYLHIDLNCVLGEMMALERLWDRVVSGGLVIFDDFGWIPNYGQNQAETAFMRDRDHMILELPTGQGVVIKR